LSSSPGRARQRLAGLAVVACLAGSGRAVAAEPTRGTICIAPFHVATPESGEPTASGPILSQTTWPPQADSAFAFRIDQRPSISLRNHEMVAVTDLPTDRKVKVVVRLDGQPFEAFSLDLGAATEHRICLWLYPGYWHWIDNGWSPELGCKCGTESVQGAR
jgi:hypothetical protein